MTNELVYGGEKIRVSDKEDLAVLVNDLCNPNGVSKVTGANGVTYWVGATNGVAVIGIDNGTRKVGSPRTIRTL